jgi:hypothetical protein
MKREDLGALSTAEQSHEIRDADRLAWLDAHRVYVEVGKSGQPGSGYITFGGEAWEARVKLADGRAYCPVADDNFSTFREALDALREALP